MDRSIPESIRPSFERTTHPFYMWDELMKTPDALQTVLTPAVSEQIKLAAAKIREVDVVHLVGCGTSYFSSIAGTYALQSIAGVRAQAHNAFEFSAYPPPRLDNSALVAISHTGGTAVVLDSVALAQQKGAVTIGITDVEDSILARTADYVLRGGAGREKQLPKTRSYISSLLKHYLLAVEVAAQNGKDIAKLCALLETSPQTARRVLDDSSELARDIARSLSVGAQVYLFGGGPHVASAMEGTLKLQESVQAHAYGFELEEGMHGPWVTMESEDLVIVYAVQGPSFEKAKGFIDAISAVGARVWVMTDHPQPIPGANYSTHLPQVPEVVSPLYGTIPIYEFTYELALARGIRPDVMRLTDDRFLDARLKLPR